METLFKQLVSATSEMFAVWIHDEFVFEPGVWLKKSDIANRFNQYANYSLDVRTVMKLFKAAVPLFDLALEETVHRQGNSSVRSVRVVVTSNRLALRVATLMSQPLPVVTPETKLTELLSSLKDVDELRSRIVGQVRTLSKEVCKNLEETGSSRYDPRSRIALEKHFKNTTPEIT